MDLLVMAGLKAFGEDVGVVVIDFGVGISLAAVSLEDCFVDCTVIVAVQVLLFIRTGSGGVVELSGVAEEVARLTWLKPAIGIIDKLVEEPDVIELAVTVTPGGKAATVVLADKENCIAAPTGGTPVQ